MDHVTITEMMTFSNEISSRDVKIKEKEHIIEEKDCEIERLNLALAEANNKINTLSQALEHAQMMLQKAGTFNMIFHTYFVLKREKVKLFFASIRDISIASFCYMFLLKTLSEETPKEVLADINEMVTLNGWSDATINVFEENSHCLVANGEMTDNEFTI